MRCSRCEQAALVEVRRAKLAERDGAVVVVRDVPMQECPACGDRWLAWQVAAALDEMLTATLDAGIQVGVRRYHTGM
jgi:YgiT-type zinc finger domain-containing protein